MQDKTVDEMIKIIKDALKRHFGNKISNDFGIEIINEDINHREFTLSLNAYRYYWVRIGCSQCHIGACILYSQNTPVFLDLSQKYWEDDFDIDLFMEEMKKEIELRIPDKYLKAKGWL
ncbi:hypothetical protein [Candidatus Ruminimicrobiellum ovillum]|jgi:hypothetical protein|uniref:hypothetical protein n=1 Tax=Candidatus Ruminimicrobiellum ovillum TaxID=1947927 RepID=UPI00355A7312